MTAWMEEGKIRWLKSHRIELMSNIWEIVKGLDEREEPYVLVTVVRRVRPSSATIGDKAVVTPDGEMKGFVGGHCTQELVVRRALECLRTGESRLLLVTPQPPAEVPEGVTVEPMTCSSEGTVELFLEPIHVNPRLVIVGASPIAHALEELAPRFTLVPKRISLEEADSNSTGDPVTILRNQLHVRDNTPVFGVVATMGVYDVDGLMALAALPLRYLGLVTSPKRWSTVRDELANAGASSEFIHFITAPAGLDIGAVGPQEIALSILAQIVERRRRGSNAGWEGEKAPEPTKSGAAADRSVPVEPQEVIDPVCGMTVDLSKTPHRLEYEGIIYGFCCRGCLDRFARDPAMYLKSHA